MQKMLNNVKVKSGNEKIFVKISKAKPAYEMLYIYCSNLSSNDFTNNQKNKY